MNLEKKRNEKKPKSVQSEHQKKMKEEGFGLDQLKSKGEDPNPNQFEKEQSPLLSSREKPNLSNQKKEKESK